MESGAKGCEVVVSGKLRAARAKSMKFTVRSPPHPHKWTNTDIWYRTVS
jgi:ribosomal protein S3